MIIKKTIWYKLIFLGACFCLLAGCNNADAKETVSGNEPIEIATLNISAQSTSENDVEQNITNYPTDDTNDLSYVNLNEKQIYDMAINAVNDKYDSFGQWGPCIGFMIPEENIYYLESYISEPSYSMENSTRFTVEYYEYDQCAYVHFDVSDDDEISFTEIEISDSDKGNNNPWYCYDYHREEDFSNITGVDWEEVTVNMNDLTSIKMDEFMPVLNSTASVRMFDSLNDDNYYETFLSELMVESIGFSDIDSDGNNEMIMSIWDNNTWKILVVSHIGENYYAHIFEEYGFLFLSQEGIYYKAMNEPDPYRDYYGCKIDISENGFYEDIILSFDDTNGIYMINGEESTEGDVREYERNETGVMVRFYNVKEKNHYDISITYPDWETYEYLLGESKYSELKEYIKFLEGNGVIYLFCGDTYDPIGDTLAGLRFFTGKYQEFTLTRFALYDTDNDGDDELILDNTIGSGKLLVINYSEEEYYGRFYEQTGELNLPDSVEWYELNETVK